MVAVATGADDVRLATHIGAYDFEYLERSGHDKSGKDAEDDQRGAGKDVVWSEIRVVGMRRLSI